MLGAFVAVVGGAAGGAGMRLLLGRIKRGMTVRPGPLEVLAAIITLAGFLLVGPGPRLGPVIMVGLLMVGLSWIDIAHHRLPDLLTLPSLAVAVALVVITEALVPDSGSWWRALACGAALAVVFFLITGVSPRSMGRGDVKLVPTLGVLTGYAGALTTVVAIALAFVLGALVALVGLAARRMTMASALPFGPFLLLGAWTALVLPGFHDLLMA